MYLYDIYRKASCCHGEIRLSGVGSTPIQGRVELCLSGQWYTMCDYHWPWSNNEAGVVCAQLGYSRESKIEYYSKIHACIE